MPFTVDKQKINFSVSVTPTVEVQGVAGKHKDMTVLHEDIRASLGGSGTIVGHDDDLVVNSGTSAGQWEDGTYTKVDSAGSAGTDVLIDDNTECVFIKHMGLLSDGTACDDADTLQIMAGADFSAANDTSIALAELKKGEAIVLPRPGNMVRLYFKTGNSTNHVQVQFLINCT